MKRVLLLRLPLGVLGAGHPLVLLGMGGVDMAGARTGSTTDRVKRGARIGAVCLRRESRPEVWVESTYKIAGVLRAIETIIQTVQ